MENTDFDKLFQKMFAKNGLSAHDTPENRRKFHDLADILIEENSKYNLTALTDYEKIIPLHFADCVAIADFIPKNAKILDIGCGGGFPTLPIAIVRPDINVCGLDSTAKKLGFIDLAAKKLDLTNVSTLTGRAEELVSGRREAFDMVISRAVARLNILAEFCLPYVKENGIFLAMKGSAGLEELCEAQNGIIKLGGIAEKVTETQIYTSAENETCEKRTNIVIRKQNLTPAAYPRAFGAIKKKPL